MKMEESLLAGISIIDISPRAGAELAGYPHFLRHNTRVHDPLYASCVYLKLGKEQIVIVTLDLLFFSKKYTAIIKKRINDRFGIPENNLVFFCSHTHSGPWACERLDLDALEAGLGADEEYVFELMNRLEILIKSAIENPFRAKIGMSVGICGAEQGVGGNRRDPSGISDPSVPVIGIADMSGSLRACFTSYALHPTFLHGESTEVSADYPGYIRRYLKWAKEDMVLLFAQGASGDQSSRYFRDGQNFEEACRVGTTIGVEINRLLENMEFQEIKNLFVKSELVPTKLRKLPSSSSAEAVLVEARDKLKALKDKSAPYLEIRNAELDVLGAEDILGYARMKEGGKAIPIEVDELPISVTIIGIGDIRIVGIQGEVFAEFGINIKEKSPFEKTIFCELCNGAAPGYIFTHEALKTGGYETDTSLMAPEMGEYAVEIALKLLNEPTD